MYCIEIYMYRSPFQTYMCSRQGAHSKVVSFISDADNAFRLKGVLRSMPRNTRTAETFAQRVNATFPQISICPRTASNWMHQLSFHPGGVHSTVYKDGHEREDSIAQRRSFISLFSESLFPRMDSYVGPDLLTVVPAQGCSVGEKRLLWYVHDESICDTSGGRHRPWQEEGHLPIKPPRGQSIMISGFVSPYGMQREDYVSIEPGAGKDGYWCNRDLIAQLNAWLPTLCTRFPEHKVVVQFDNSANHGVMAPDALVASRLNLSDGYPKLTASDTQAGMAQTAFRNTRWQDGGGIWHEQSFLYTDGTMDNKVPTRPAHKGIQTILTERGLWRKQTIRGRHVPVPPTEPLALGVEGPSVPAGTTRFIKGDGMLLDEALLLLSQQPDFVAQSKKNWITEIVESYGHIAVFGPKFHPELAVIEYFWGQMKKYLRSRCDYKLESLRRLLPEAIASVSLTTIRRYFAHVRRYMRAYANDSLSLCQIEWAMRKYSSHRRAKEPPADVDDTFLTPAWFEDMPEKLEV